MTNADAEDWRFSLADDGRWYVFEPADAPPRAQLTVLEEDGYGGHEPVISAFFSPYDISELGEYCTQLADYLKGTR